MKDILTHPTASSSCGRGAPFLTNTGFPYLEPALLPTTTMPMTRDFQSEENTLIRRQFSTTSSVHRVMSRQERYSHLMSTIDRVIEICDHGLTVSTGSTGQHSQRDTPTTTTDP
jgi:hypothetical protein